MFFFPQRSLLRDTFVGTEQDLNIGMLVTDQKGRILVRLKRYLLLPQKGQVFGIELLDIHFKRMITTECSSKIYDRSVKTADR
jgi:membrane protease subunit HflC